MKINLFESAPKPFLPEKLPIENLDKILMNEETINLMIRSSNKMGTYDGFLRTAVNPMLLISPLLTQESVLSSKLEGTHATLEDFLNFEAGNETSIEPDEMAEIANYRAALSYALENLSTVSNPDRGTLPLSTRIIKQMHRILLSNVRGSTKNPGQFKRSQNYIGNAEHISFTPVPPNLTEEYMSNLENYIHAESEKTLIQAAIIHAQFEMIHPFEDGNGRIGRLLIPLFLYYKDYLPYPTFYMSEYFENNRKDYIEHLANISLKNDWLNWIKFFLEGVIIQAASNTKKASRLMSLYEDMKINALNKISSKYTINVLDFIFAHPIFKSAQLKKELSNVSDGTVYSLINQFIEHNLLQKSDQKRNVTYYCPEIILSI